MLCRDHVHMNSTKFHTLTEFVKYLGRTGKCRVDETEKGWFISLIQEDPMEKLSTERRLKRDRRAPVCCSMPGCADGLTWRHDHKRRVMPLKCKNSLCKAQPRMYLDVLISCCAVSIP